MEGKNPSQEPVGTDLNSLSNAQPEPCPQGRIRQRSILTGTSSVCSADILDRYGSIRSVDHRALPNKDDCEDLDRYATLRSPHPSPDCNEHCYSCAMERNPDLGRYGSLTEAYPPRPLQSSTDATLPMSPVPSSEIIDAIPVVQPEPQPILYNVVSAIINDEHGQAWTVIMLQPTFPPSARESINGGFSHGTTQGRVLRREGTNARQAVTQLQENRSSDPQVSAGPLNAPAVSAVSSAKSSPCKTISNDSSASLDVCPDKKQPEPVLSFTEGTNRILDDDAIVASLPVQRERLGNVAEDICRPSLSAWSEPARGYSLPTFSSTSSIFRGCIYPLPSQNTPHKSEEPYSDLTPIVLYEAPGLTRPAAPPSRHSSWDTCQRRQALFDDCGASPINTGSCDADIQCSAVSTTRPLLQHREALDGREDKSFLLMVFIFSSVLLGVAIISAVTFYFLYSALAPSMP